MRRLAVSVEGQTEEEFVNAVLSEHLWAVGVAPTPILLGRARGGRGGGGGVGVEKLVSEMTHLRRSFDVVTSLVDFYGFRGRGGGTVEELEERLIRGIGGAPVHRENALPYVQKYEFEGLLFSDVTAFRTVTGVSEQCIDVLRRARAQFRTPEDIDNGYRTTPAKRIADAIPHYRKRVHGPQVAKKIGLAEIRRQCPRFDEWVRRLEALGHPV